MAANGRHAMSISLVAFGRLPLKINAVFKITVDQTHEMIDHNIQPTVSESY
jgi:hypothetical protein